MMPGLPFLPFALLGLAMGSGAFVIPQRRAKAAAELATQEQQAAHAKQEEERNSVKEILRTSEVELCLGRQLSGAMLVSHGELAHRVAKMRRKFAQQFGFVIPEIKLTDDLGLAPRTYCIKIHGTIAATGELRIGEILVIPGNRPRPDVPGDDVKEPAFGMDALWIPEMFASELRSAGYQPVDSMSVMLTHLSETIRNNLANLLSYRDLRALTDRLEPEYKRLLDETCPSLLSFSSLQAILKLLLAERVSIRNLHLVLEAIAEIAPHVRKPETIVEHVRMRISQQICGDLGQDGMLRVVRLGNRWDLAFLQSLKRDAKGDVIEFDIDPRLIEQFATDATKAIKRHMDEGESFALVTAPEARPYVRMIIDRLFPNLPVLSHVEISRGIKVEAIGSFS
jgi:flagellar biosynthesis protein FlhA